MPREARKEGYSRLHRFAEHGSFGPVLRGARKFRGRFVVLHILPTAAPASRLGVALTRKLVPSSVQRNLVKRIAREAFRRHPAKRLSVDCVVALRSRFEPSMADALAVELVELFDRLVPPAAAA
jgi:ribonuclease P protein component